VLIALAIGGFRALQVAYVERRRSEGENFLLPALIIVAGALVVVALVPLRRLRKHA